MKDVSGKRKVQFVVTGFGPFRGVKENPTTILSNRLIGHLKHVEEKENKSGDVKLSDITETVVIETSAEGARAELDTLRKDLVAENGSQQEEDTDPTTFYVLLHLGVNYKGEKFQLEKFAYNDASFRIPDERGYQPKKKHILDNKELGSAPETRFDLESIKELLRVDDDLVCVSDNPGRFVCNYTYCYSMARFDDEKRFRSLFLHVPPFGVVGVEDQLEFVTCLMRTLYHTTLPCTQ